MLLLVINTDLYPLCQARFRTPLCVLLVYHTGSGTWLQLLAMDPPITCASSCSKTCRHSLALLPT